MVATLIASMPAFSRAAELICIPTISHKIPYAESMSASFAEEKVL